MKNLLKCTTLTARSAHDRSKWTDSIFLVMNFCWVAKPVQEATLRFFAFIFRSLGIRRARIFFLNAWPYWEIETVTKIKKGIKRKRKKHIQWNKYKTVFSNSNKIVAFANVRVNWTKNELQCSECWRKWWQVNEQQKKHRERDSIRRQRVSNLHDNGSCATHAIACVLWFGRVFQLARVLHVREIERESAKECSKFRYINATNKCGFLHVFLSMFLFPFSQRIKNIMWVQPKSRYNVCFFLSFSLSQEIVDGSRTIYDFSMFIDRYFRFIDLWAEFPRLQATRDRRGLVAFWSASVKTLMKWIE